MTQLWMQVAVTIGGVAAAAVLLKRLFGRKPSHSQIDGGVVSEAWLAEQRGGRDPS